MAGTIVPMTGYAPVSITIFTSRPSRSPSLPTAARTSKLSSRACPDAVRFSLRSSIHLTGRPRERDAAATASARRAAGSLPGGPVLHAERAADIAGQDAHLVRLHAEAHGDAHPGDVHALR